MDILKDNKTEFQSDPLWKAFRRGDKTAFEIIYRTHVRDLLNYGYKVTADRRLIEDSIQDLFFELWQSKENLSHTNSIKFYLFRALRNKIVRNAKDNDLSFTSPIEDRENDAIHYSHENDLIELETRAIQKAHLKEIIEKLPKRQQEAINLRYYHNFTNEEIADIMGVNYQSACKFIYSALKTLKLNLSITIISLFPPVLLFFSHWMG
jgi:RNA polymerase sigma factor (sigma-70 family)